MAYDKVKYYTESFSIQSLVPNKNSDSVMDYKALADRIIELKNADMELRDSLIENGQMGEGYNSEMEKLHNKNAAILNEIIDTIAYPTVDKVGKEASEAAWLVIQHSIGQPSFMKKCEKLLDIAVKQDKANPSNLAFLSDRIASFEGNNQLYGTQFDWDKNGELSPRPFDNLSKVNQRRSSIGLNKLEEQTGIVRDLVKKENQAPPSNIEKRNQKMEKWKKSVGWKK